MFELFSIMEKISFQLYLIGALFRQLFSGASGGPAGGQTYEKFDKQVLRSFDHLIAMDKVEASGFISMPERF